MLHCIKQVFDTNVNQVSLSIVYSIYKYLILGVESINQAIDFSALYVG